jgi:hypothetical protein
MRVTLATIAALALLGACERKDDDTGARMDNERSGTDTLIQSETVRDTTIIRADTSIEVDTLKKTDNIGDVRRD